MISQAVKFADEVLLGYGVGRSVSMAAYSLFKLNRGTSGLGYGDKQEVYRLKGAMLRWLYENGYTVSVGRDVQVFECWDCWGSGNGEAYYLGVGRDGPEWEYEECWKCRGTGVYRENVLVSFVFLVDGKVYRWHQPLGLVDWVNERDWSEAVVDEGKRIEGLIQHDGGCMGAAEVRWHAMVVWGFLVSRGVWVRLPMRLYPILLRGWRRGRYYFPNRVLGRWVNRVKWWLRRNRGQRVQVERDWLEDEIPF